MYKYIAEPASNRGNPSGETKAPDKSIREATQTIIDIVAASAPTFTRTALDRSGHRDHRRQHCWEAR